MDTKELEIKLEGQAETQAIDFKQAGHWDVNSLAKDILAMSNVRDGGFIIIGVKEGEQGFEREGVTEAIRATYKIDEIKDQMTQFADPHVDLMIHFPKDKNGLEYIVIRVLQFEEIPVICRKESPAAGTHAGVLYYRNKDRRTESASVSNSYDMRTIIESATVKMMQRRMESGFVVKTDKTTTRKKLEEELEGL
jgi:predicted HTH transcriptional regulator